MLSGQYLLSTNQCFRAVLQFNGNFVVYRNSDNQAIWAINLAGIFLTLTNINNSFLIQKFKNQSLQQLHFWRFVHLFIIFVFQQLLLEN